MPFWRTYYHLVWATYQRAPLLQPALEGRLFAYLTKRAEAMGVHVYAIGGRYDHLHLVVSIPPSLPVAEVVRQLKASSSRHINQNAGLAERFQWERGYGALTLGERQRAQVEAYVRQHEEHHSQQDVNRWLERTYSFEEGPPTETVAPEGLLTALREKGPVYP